MLRSQMDVLERQRGRRVRYRPADRVILAAVGRVLPPNRSRSFLVTPHTLLRLAAGAGGQEMAAWRRRRGSGRPPMPAELTELICRFARENCSWGCVRVQGELAKLGIRASATTIR